LVTNDLKTPRVFAQDLHNLSHAILDWTLRKDKGIAHFLA